MDKYIESLKLNLAEQFKDKEHINELLEVFDRQFMELYQFYKELDENRSFYTAEGQQLDGIGDIVVMTRKDAQELSGEPISLGDIDDETYRQYLIYKVLKNTSNTTYPEIIKAFRMFWDRPLYYREDPEQPATMIFDTGEMQGHVDTTPLFKTPLIRAAGVTLKLYARTSVPMEKNTLHLFSGLGYALTESLLPIVERDYDFQGKLHIGSDFQNMTQDMLPELERELDLESEIHVGSSLHTITHDMIPGDFISSILSTSEDNVSIMETPIGSISTQN